MGTEWVPLVQAVPALQRVRNQLMRQGWGLIAYEDSRYRVRLSLRPPNTDDTVSVEAYSGDCLQVTARAACAGYPSGTALDHLGRPELPAQETPARLRG